MIHVLIVDDEARLSEVFKRELTAEGMNVMTAPSAEDAISIIGAEQIDVAVLDIKLPDMDGVELLQKAKSMEPAMEVIMLTGFASIDTAIQSMKLGAYDYLTKPCKITELANVIAKAYEKKALRDKNVVLEEHLQRLQGTDRLIGESEQIRRVREFIAVVGASRVPVLLLGETGTGKGVAARAIHDMSPRRENPFVTINASTLQENILESELFGYKKGAFTGAQTNKIGLLQIANNGTFFVDEVGDMGSSIQAKMLRVLETGAFMKLGDTKETTVDVRFIFATNANLKKDIEGAKFRKDLFFRINAFTITLPPLRERKDDILLLADHFVAKSSTEMAKHLSADARALLNAYDWPGNVRELANVIERAVLLSGPRAEIRATDFPEDMTNSIFVGKKIWTRENDALLSLDILEQQYVEKVLQAVGNNKSEAARILGIGRARLYSKIKKTPSDPHPAE